MIWYDMIWYDMIWYYILGHSNSKIYKKNHPQTLVTCYPIWLSNTFQMGGEKPPTSNWLVKRSNPVDAVDIFNPAHDEWVFMGPGEETNLKGGFLVAINTVRYPKSLAFHWFFVVILFFDQMQTLLKVCWNDNRVLLETKVIPIDFLSSCTT